MKEMSLAEMLLEYGKNDFLPMHMPGHKRSDRFSCLAPLPFSIDITEIDGFDNLNSPEGIFARSEEIAASLWGSDMCLYSVNGSSGAILAGIRAALGCRHGKKVILTRNAHKSVYNAIELCGCVPVYLSQRIDPYGVTLSLDPSAVKEAICSHPDAALVIVTSPTYEGVISDIRSIADICHEKGIPLMVDEAHGAHLGLHGIFPNGAISCGADIAVQSLHKTLPSLTQTAVIHVKGNIIDKNEIRRQMATFQSSSPSYILSASIDSAVRFLSSKEGVACLKEWYDCVSICRKKLSSLNSLSLFGKNEEVFDLDPSKLVICGSGTKLGSYLRHEHRIELEMTSACYAVAMSGAGDTPDSLNRFISAVFEADEAIKAKTGCFVKGTSFPIPRLSMKPSEAVIKPSVDVTLCNAIGKVSSGYVYAYPPGVPLLTPGEVIMEEIVEIILTLKENCVRLHGIDNGMIKIIK